jgi:hypothetical protein
MFRLSALAVFAGHADLRIPRSFSNRTLSSAVAEKATHSIAPAALAAMTFSFIVVPPAGKPGSAMYA